MIVSENKTNSEYINNITYDDRSYTTIGKNTT